MIDTFIHRLEKAIPDKTIRRILLHFLFWCIWLARNFYDTQNVWGIQSSLLFVLIVFCTQAPLVYFHLYVLVPKLLNRKYYVLHIIVTILCIILYSYLNYSLLQYIPKAWISNPMIAFLKNLKPSYDLLEGFIAVVLTYSLKYMLIAFITQNELLKLQKEKLQLELRALKAQINPHFFFNTLNNLYSLTLKNSEKSSEVVLKLSDMMRYVLYECNEDKVLLSKELSFLKNYLELERLRFNESYQINYSQTGEPSEQQIAPMILIEFVENSFKHGLSRHFSSGRVTIDIQVEKDNLLFSVSNSKGNVDYEKGAGISGIGLINVKKRLSLIYQDQFHLEIKETEDQYQVFLSLPLQS